MFFSLQCFLQLAHVVWLTWQCYRLRCWIITIFNNYKCNTSEQVCMEKRKTCICQPHNDDQIICHIKVNFNFEFGVCQRCFGHCCGYKKCHWGNLLMKIMTLAPVFALLGSCKKKNFFEVSNKWKNFCGILLSAV